MKFKTVSNLQDSFHPYPKPLERQRKAQKPIGKGKKTKNWESGRQVLKKIFEGWEITSCEIRLGGCLGNELLTFAHTERRNNLTMEEVRQTNKVVLACQPCHYQVDFVMNKKEGKQLLESIIAKRAYL